MYSEKYSPGNLLTFPDRESPSPLRRRLFRCQSRNRYRYRNIPKVRFPCAKRPLEIRKCCQKMYDICAPASFIMSDHILSIVKIAVRKFSARNISVGTFSYGFFVHGNRRVKKLNSQTFPVTATNIMLRYLSTNLLLTD